MTKASRHRGVEASRKQGIPSAASASLREITLCALCALCVSVAIASCASRPPAAPPTDPDDPTERWPFVSPEIAELTRVTGRPAVYDYTEAQAVAAGIPERVLPPILSPGPGELLTWYAQVDPNHGWYTYAEGDWWLAPDINRDGVVNGADLTILLNAWGDHPWHSVVGETHPADLNADGVVDGRDMTILLLSWGSCVGERLYSHIRVVTVARRPCYIIHYLDADGNPQARMVFGAEITRDNDGNFRRVAPAGYEDLRVEATP